MTIENQLKEPILHEVFAVKATKAQGVFEVDVDLTDIQGERYRCIYVSAPDDPVGLAPAIRQWLTDNEGTYSVEAYSAQAPGSVPYQIAKTTPWRRMTENEAAILDAIMSETSARTKQIYMAAQYLSSDDELWGTLHAIIAEALGNSRADELLAPEV